MNIGMNFHSPKLVNHEGLLKLDLRWALFIADIEEPWNDTLRLWPEVKALCPRCEPVVRFYRPNIMGESPEFRAKQFCDILTERFGDQPVNAIMGNELDQAIEHGGHDARLNGEVRPWSDKYALVVIASWLSRYADAHRAIRPQDILHLPACSAGMKDRVIEYWNAMPVSKYEYRDLHWYDLSTDFRRFPDPHLAVTEWGKIGGTPEEYAAFALSLGDTMNCIWKWLDKDSNPEGDPAGYAIADRPDVIDALVNQESAPESNAVIYEDELKEWPKEDKSMKQQQYLDIVSDIWATAEELTARSVYARYRKDLAERIQKQCEILDDLKIQEGGSAPAPFLGG